MNSGKQNIQTNAHTRQNFTSQALPFMVFICGLVLTGLLFLNSVQVDNNWVADRLKRGTDTLVDLINPENQIPNPLRDQIITTLMALRTEISTETQITQEFLDNHFWDEPPFGLETSTIEYLPRISFNEAREMQSRFRNRISNEFKIVQKDSGVISPAPVRDEYFPVLLESGNQDWGTVLGEDRSINNPLINIALEQARDSGEMVTHAFFPLVDYGDQTMQSHNYYAIYETGYVPDSIEERREKLSGFVSVVSYYPLVKDFLAFYSESYQGLELIYFPLSGSYQRMEKSAGILRGIEAGLFLETTYFLKSQGGQPWMALSRANQELITNLQTPTRWRILVLGILFTLWISGMIFWYRKQSEKLSMQVQEHSDELRQQTEKLEEMDKRLHESQTQYKLLAENTSNVIYTFDLEGVCTYISPSITKQSGFQAEAYIGKRGMEHLSEASAKAFNTKLESLKNSAAEAANEPENTSVIECEMTCIDGSVKPMSNTLSLVFDDQGLPTGLLGVVSPGQ